MLYPQFREAEYSTSTAPVKSPTGHYVGIILRGLLLVFLFIAICFMLLCLLKLTISDRTEGIYLNVISISASIVTFFSAIISVLSLLDANCMQKYEDNLTLLEDRYLGGKRLPKWEFLKRCSYYSKKNTKHSNYYITSAHYKLYCNNSPLQYLDITVPNLETDFHSVPCISSIIRIRSFIPRYLTYISDEQTKYNNSSQKPPNYYIPLPNNIIALYKKILEHKVLKCSIFLCFMLIICAIIVTITCMIDYRVIFNVLSSQ